MNICYISANSIIPSRSANSIHIMKMCQAYASLGHRVTLIVPNHPIVDNLENGDVFDFYGLRHRFAIWRLPLPKWCPDTAGYGILLPLAVLSTRPDFVHSRSLAPAWGLASLFHLPTIFETHDSPSLNAWPKRLFDWLMASSYLRALVVITQALADHVRPMTPMNTRLLVAADGVDAEWLQRSNSLGAARAELGLSHEKRRIVVYTGHLYRGRGIELIIELAQRMSDHLFLIVGGREPEIAYYRQQTSQLNNFHLVGFMPPARVLTYLQAADALLMPYSDKVEVVGGGDTSSFCSPMKMFEYMAAGRPILSSALPVLREVLKDGVNGLLLPYDEPRRWMEALRRLQQDGKLAKTLGHQAQRDVQKYTWEKRAQSILQQIGFE